MLVYCSSVVDDIVIVMRQFSVVSVFFRFLCVLYVLYVLIVFFLFMLAMGHVPDTNK